MYVIEKMWNKKLTRSNSASSLPFENLPVYNEQAFWFALPSHTFYKTRIPMEESLWLFKAVCNLVGKPNSEDQR